MYLNTTPVRDIEDVQVGLNASSIEAKTLREADVKLFRVRSVQRARLDQRHVDRSPGAAREVALERGKDLRIRCHVVGRYFRPRNDLDHRAHLEAPQRRGIDAEDLEIRLEGRLDVTVQ